MKIISVIHKSIFQQPSLLLREANAQHQPRGSAASACMLLLGYFDKS
jgi:hypothetical protein